MELQFSLIGYFLAVDPETRVGESYMWLKYEVFCHGNFSRKKTPNRSP